jgi:hypothetical protein
MTGRMCRFRTLSSDPDTVRPGESVEEVILRWPDGSGFKMQMYAAPTGWDGKSEGQADKFYMAVHELIQSATDDEAHSKGNGGFQ